MAYGGVLKMRFVRGYEGFEGNEASRTSWGFMWLKLGVLMGNDKHEASGPLGCVLRCYTLGNTGVTQNSSMNARE